jgi:hypothetical protein
MDQFLSFYPDFVKEKIPYAVAVKINLPIYCIKNTNIIGVILDWKNL